MKHGTLHLALIVGLSVLTAACEGGTDMSGGMICEDGVCRAASTIGDSCKSDDPNHLCLGLKTVSYLDTDGKPQVSSQTSAANVRVMNQIFSACNVGFQLEDYRQVNPADYGLSGGAGAANELDTIRRTFEDDRRLLIVMTGYWGTTKNAWTQMPGTGIYGAIFENSVAAYPNIWAHEIGHYLNLDHVSDPSDVMNALIYPDSTKLTADQCSAVRDAATGYWSAMLR